MKIPIWVLILILVSSGIGAAAGTALYGRIGGNVNVVVSSPLILDPNRDPIEVIAADYETHTFGDNGRTFSIMAAVDAGETFKVKLYLENRSDEDLFGKLILMLPTFFALPNDDHGFKISVKGFNAVGKTYPIGPYTWIFFVSEFAGNNDDDYIEITVKVPSKMPPGSYNIEGRIEEVA